MAKSKKQIIESLAAVKNVGPKYAEAAYDELGIRSVDDLAKAAEKGELQKLSGIGAKKEKSILASAKEAGGAKPAKTPSKPKSSSKSKSSKSKPKADKPKAKADKPKADKPKAKADKPKAKAETKTEAKNDDKKAQERPKTTSSTARPRPQSNYRPRDRKKKSSNPIVFVGKLVFKIAKKLLS